MNKLIAYVHVGTHGSCVRSNYHAFESLLTLNGRTARASLFAIPAILTYNLTHIVPLFHPFYAVVPAILHANMGHIVLLAPTFKFPKPYTASPKRNNMRTHECVFLSCPMQRYKILQAIASPFQFILQTG